MAIAIVAEGVKIQKQADFLLANAYDQVQGFYYNRATPQYKSTRTRLAQAYVFRKTYLPSGRVSNINFGSKVCEASKAANIAKPVKKPKYTEGIKLDRARIENPTIITIDV